MSHRFIHFGVYHPEPARIAAVDDHTDPRVERQVTLPEPLNLTEAVVSGSWGCWGPADQDTDGDQSLHVAVRCGVEPSVEWIRETYLALAQVVEAPGYVLAWGTVTTEDWSETTMLWVYDPGMRRVEVYDPTAMTPPRPAERLYRKPQRCAHAGPGFTDESGHHVVAYVDRGEPGYYETTYVGDLDYCVATAKAINETLGVTRDEELAIVASSMAAGAIR